MAEKKTNKNQRQQQAVIRIVIMMAILVCVNVLASYFHKGFDLTKEKRFTLSEPTIKLLKNMHETAVIEVYLKDDHFPAGIQRLQEAVRERLNSFKNIAGNKIIYRFINPYEGKSEDEKTQIAKDLNKKGIIVTELQTSDDDEFSSKTFFPYALVQYNGKEMPIYLLENPSGATSPEAKISYAETILEYKFADALNVMGRPDVAHIAYLTGNGEPVGVTSYDMLATLSRHYWVDTVDLGHWLDSNRKDADLSHLYQSLLAYDALIIVQPTIPFTLPEKIRLDQYIMRGGHVLFSVNMVKASLDSLAKNSQFIAMESGLEIDDLFYKYGARVNNDVVEDIANLPLPRTVNDGKPVMHDWIYFPKLNPTADHPIVRNMDFIRAGFTNSIDTIRNADIKKTVLLQTSKYSLRASAPARISLSQMNYQMKEELFTKSYLPVAVLLEGKFRSAFENKLAPESLRYLNDPLKQPFKAACDSDNKIIITSVGDIFTNTYSTKDGVRPMGYYPWTGEYFANRDFLLNCVEYLTDKSGILEARSKEVKVRLLDNGRVKSEKSTWQMVNVGIPIAVVLVFASAYFFFRKRRYEVKQNEVKPPSQNA